MTRFVRLPPIQECGPVLISAHVELQAESVGAGPARSVSAPWQAPVGWVRTVGTAATRLKSEGPAWIRIHIEWPHAVVHSEMPSRPHRRRHGTPNRQANGDYHEYRRYQSEGRSPRQNQNRHLELSEAGRPQPVLLRPPQ